MLNKRVLLLLICVSLLCAFLIAGHAFAQESTPEPTPSPIGGLLEGIPSPGEVANGFVDWVGGLAFAGGLVVTILTAFVKRFDALADIPSSVVKAGVTLVLIILAYVTGLLGLQNQFNDVLKGIIALITAFGATAAGSELWYKTALQGLPLIGTPRPKIKLE